MRRALVFGFLILLLTATAFADGPETGLVTGKVVNADGEGLPGVQVTLEGGRGQQVSVTNEGGTYRFSLVPPGAYTVKAALEGFTEGHHEVQVTAGGKAEANITMRLETAETITVTSEAPMVDKFNVSAGSAVTSEVGAQAAGENRTYYGVINMLPGVTSDAENGAIQGTRPQVNGSHFADNSVFIDGVDTSFARFGGSRVFVPTTATTEIALEAGGMSAEYGRVVGSTTNVIIKSGTNVFHGDFLYGRSDTDWNADWKDQPKLDNKEFPTTYQNPNFPVTTPRPPYPTDFLKRLPDEKGESDNYELGLGGPIVKDKAWFFVAYSENDTLNLDKTLDQEIVDASFDFRAAIGKLSFQPSQSHQLSGSYIDAPSKRVYFHTPSHDRWNPTPHDLAGDLATLSWNWSMTTDFFLETKLATQTSDENKYLAEPTGHENVSVEQAIAAKQQDPRFPGNPSAGPHWPGNNFASYWDSRDDSTWHNGWILDNGFGLNEYPRDQANLAATWFPNENHELKFGADWQEVEWNSNVRVVDLYVGPDFNALDPAGFTNCNIVFARYCVWFDRRPADVLDDGNTNHETGFTQSDTSTEVASLYARDRFTIGDHWIFNVGGRVSQMDGYNDIRRKVMDDLNWEPRLAATYDIKANGKMLASINAGRYHAQLNQQFISQWMQDLWTGSLGNDATIWCGDIDVLVDTVLAPGALGGACSTTGYRFPLSFTRTGGAWDWIDAGLWEHDLEAYYKDEVMVGFEWQFANNWAFDAKGIVYELGDMIGNTIQRDPNGVYMDLTANYKNYKDILRRINAEAVRLGNAPMVPESSLDWFREGRKEYEALQIQVNRRFAKSWALYTNVTWADTSSTGSGAWWNNTDSTYAYDLGTVITEDVIRQCELRQEGIVSGPVTGQVKISNGRSVPLDDCRERLTPWLGAPASIVNRFGKDGVQSERYDEGGALADRPIIAKAFGFKQWSVGKHTFNLGGFYTWQSGIAWGRAEPASPLADSEGNSGAVQFGNGLDVFVEPVGERRTAGYGWLNLSGAWGFPVMNRVSGEFRVEVTNVTDHQLQVNINDQGEVQPVRRDFNLPRQARGSVSFRF
jgi:hypothetical protein